LGIVCVDVNKLFCSVLSVKTYFTGVPASNQCWRRLLQRMDWVWCRIRWQVGKLLVGWVQVINFVGPAGQDVDALPRWCFRLLYSEATK